MRLDEFGPAERLHAALRRRAPQMAVCVVRDEDTGLPHVRVTYRHAGSRLVAWDGRRYRWELPGWDETDPFLTDPEEAADRIAEALGARVTAPNPVEERS